MKWRSGSCHHRLPGYHALASPVVSRYYRQLLITFLDHIHIHAADPTATIRFYESCLGAEHLGSIPSGEGGRNHGVILGGQLLVISEFPPGMEPQVPPEPGEGALRSGFGVAHFGLQTTDLDGVLARLRDAGARAHADPRRTGAVRYVYVSAPDGVVIELTELHLPAHLATFMPLLSGVNKAIHLTRRALAKQLFK